MPRIDKAARATVLDALRNAGLVDAPVAPPADAFTIEPLAGGLGGRSFAASAESVSVVVRVSSEDRAGALELGVEADLTRAAAALGIAPRVVAADAASGVLITEYLSHARPLTPAALRLPTNIARAARLLKRLHTITCRPRSYDPVAYAAEYTHDPALALSAADRRRASELHALARAYRMRFPSEVLCHNDLVASNVLDDGGLKLVDFEYAVTAAPVLDIAGLAALNDFDMDERWRLAAAYYEPAPVPFTAGELAQVVRLVQLIAYFWALSSAAAGGERGAYAAFAERAAAALETIERS